MSRYIKGRSKQMYSERDKDMEAILAQIEKANKNPLIY